MDFLNRLLQSKIVILLVIGVVMLVASRVVKRGRLEGENAGVGEKILWAGGILITVAALIYAGSRGCVVDVPDKEKNDLPEYSRKAPGCSKPQEDMQEFDK